MSIYMPGRIQVRSSTDLFSKESFTVGQEKESSIFFSQSNIVMLAFRRHTAFTGECSIDIHWLNTAGDELSVDEDVKLFTEPFENKLLELKSPCFKVKLKSDYTDTVELSLICGSMYGIDDIKGLETQRRNEIVRPRHAIISSREVTVSANSHAGADDIVGSDNIYRTNTNRIYVGDFAFVYVVVNTSDFSITDNDYTVESQFVVRNDAPVHDKFNRSDFDGLKTVGQTDGSRGNIIIATNSNRADSDWIEVKGTHLDRFRLNNNDGVERAFHIALMGIR